MNISLHILKWDEKFEFSINDCLIFFSSMEDFAIQISLHSTMSVDFSSWFKPQSVNSFDFIILFTSEYYFYF